MSLDEAAPAADHVHARTLRLGGRVFRPGEPVVMGIVNRTPDSFYDNGRTYAFDAALDRVDEAVAEGAAIVDVGGVRAGEGTHVTVAEEVRRVVPLIEAVREHHPDVVVSVDTYRAGVADPACRAGADLVNDVWGGWDAGLVDVAARYGAGIVCSHTGGRLPRAAPTPVRYDDVVVDVRRTVVAAAERAVAAGVRADAVVIDPAHDFGKDTPQSLELTRRLDELVDTGWPVLVALSRKDFVGDVLGVGPDERLEGSLAAAALCAWHGARIVRAHDVRATVRALRMVAAVLDGRAEA
ncbi:MAG: dihydropteroate synthase [Streptosporangiales bacterium]|nr:dihydropteroate synthase [Streptosporangiales bacterium]MBO0891473.1 dihydropteroate synthase [Acidothermales bacterium]